MILNVDQFIHIVQEKLGLPAQKGIDIWEVENVPGFLGHIRIKNLYDGVLWGKYLYAVVDSLAFDQDRISVYTWSTNEDSNIDTWGGAGDWIMEDALCVRLTTFFSCFHEYTAFNLFFSKPLFSLTGPHFVNEFF